jgi:predicted nuclease of restriction endonuclease-like RecB superfamily
MLSKAHRVYHWTRPGRSISSDRLPDDALPSVARAIAVYRRMLGRPRGRVRDAARAALASLRPDRVEAVVELLDDVATYDWPRGGRAAERRIAVFEAVPGGRPVLDAERAAAVVREAFVVPAAGAGEAVRLASPAAVPFLYADYPEFHRLTAFPAGYGPEALRTEYDLAQAQAVLYDAVRVTVETSDDLRHIVQYARLSRLLHRIERLRAGGYRFTFDGPNSILRRTRAYGVDFARFLAALVQARGWRLEAEVVLRRGWRPVTFALTDADGLRSRVPAPELFDSKIEETLARKFGPARGGWRLEREAMILHAGEALIVPDFLFAHEDGTEVALEIVGYWTPEYVTEKLAKLERVRGTHLIVAVRKALALRAGRLPAAVLPFASGILLKDLLPRLDAFRR